MTREQEFLLTVLQKAVKGETVDALPEYAISWENFIREAKDQTVWLPVFDALTPVWDQIPVDRDAAELDAMGVMLFNSRIERAQEELTATLEQEQCPYVIMKGASAAAWYPKVQLRHLGDVDFIVPPEKTEQIKEKMISLGYNHVYHAGGYHHNLRKNGSTLELHMRIAGMPEGDSGELVAKFLESIYDCRLSLQTDMGICYVPGWAHQGLIQLLHLQNHILSGGVGLRHIMDWGLFVSGTAQEDFWQKELLPLMRRLGLFHFTAVLTKVAAVHLGTECPAWASYPEDVLCADFMEDVLTGGNFGKKDIRRNHCFTVFPDWKNQELDKGKFGRSYSSLRRVIWKQHPELKKKPVLTFLYMVAKAVRYVALYLVGKRPNLSEVAVLAQERESVYNRLKMFEKDDSQ